MARSCTLLACAVGLLCSALGVAAYEVPLQDTDYSRQICSGMWSGSNTYINVSFDSTSQGQLAMVIYEWKDYQYLGKLTSETDDFLPRTYVCTSDAVRTGFCSTSELGRFILDLPRDLSIANTSFWSARVAFPGADGTVPAFDDAQPTNSSGSSLWDNPAGNPKLPPGDWDTNIRARALTSRQQAGLNPSPDGLLIYHEPIQYLVRTTGYYCVAVVPVTVLQSSSPTEPSPRQSSEIVPTYKGSVLFQNKFSGQLAATDYPKVNFYLAMFIIYSLLGAAWGWICYQHITELLPIQYYLSCLVGFLIIEMVANLAYYRYLNAHGKGAASTVFLFVVAILDAGRNSLSFFMLLVVSLGLSVVRDNLGVTLRKCQILAAAHFVFGVLYAVGIVELEFESTSAFILLIFVIPLAFTLSGFLMWILYSLNATITQLKARKQRYKLRMFQRLQYILLFVVFVIAIFFVVSSLTFSGRLAEDYAANSWKARWWLLDGWLSLLYFFAFGAIAYLWRPSAHNGRLLMSEELAQDEEDAEDYDMEAMESREDVGHSRYREDDEATLVGGQRGPASLGEDAVVFEIGDEDAQDISDDEDDPHKRQRTPRRRSEEHHEEGDDERSGLMSGGAPKRRDD